MPCWDAALANKKSEESTLTGRTLELGLFSWAHCGTARIAASLNRADFSLAVRDSETSRPYIGPTVVGLKRAYRELRASRIALTTSPLMEFECLPRPSRTSKRHSLRLQQPLPELSIAGQGTASFAATPRLAVPPSRAQLQTALQEHGGQIVLCGGIVPLAEFAQPFSLFAAGEVGYVGHDPG